MYIVKLGGSIITDKSRKKRFRKAITLQLAKEISSSGQQVVLVHGAGSFGHIEAHRYGLHNGYSDPSQLMGFAKVQRDVRELNMKVLNTLLQADLCPVSISTSGVIVNHDGNIRYIDTDIFREYLDMALMPVAFGDVVRDTQRRFSICSGDQIMLELARTLKPKKAIFVTDVDGLYTSNPASDSKAKLIERVNARTLKSIRSSASGVTDVTGGIMGKVSIAMEMKKHGVKTLIINGNKRLRLKKALCDQKVRATAV